MVGSISLQERSNDNRRTHERSREFAFLPGESLPTLIAEYQTEYHRTLVARLQAAGLEVVELNPRAVKDARGQQLLRTLKNDARDCGAMAELLIRGSGRPPQCRDEALAEQAAWVAHRRRKVAAQIVLGNQIHGQLDLIFPWADRLLCSWP